MLHPTDHDLLQQFVRTNSESAFTTLVERYVNMVYSTALRFTSNAHHAQEITQVVFIVFARKAGKLSAQTILSGWLYETARLTSSNFIKANIRRQQREQEMYMQSMPSHSEKQAWDQIKPLLDQAMGDLGEFDRNAVIMRYFENKTAQEIAEVLKTSEAAAHKRISRALEKLRKNFLKRGVTLSSVVLAGTLTTQGMEAAPVGLLANIVESAVKGAAVPVSCYALVNATLKGMSWIKLNLAIGVLAAIALPVSLAAFVLTAERTPIKYFGNDLELQGILTLSRPQSKPGRSYSYQFRRSGLQWELKIEGVGKNQDTNWIYELLLYDGEDLFHLTKLSKHLTRSKTPLRPDQLAAADEPTPDLFLGITHGINTKSFAIPFNILWLAFEGGHYVTAVTNELPPLTRGSFSEGAPPSHDYGFLDDSMNFLKWATFNGATNWWIDDMKPSMYLPPYDKEAWTNMTYEVTLATNVIGGKIPLKFVTHFNMLFPAGMSRPGMPKSEQELKYAGSATGLVSKVVLGLHHPLQLPEMPETVNVVDMRFRQDRDGNLQWKSDNSSAARVSYTLGKTDKWPLRTKTGLISQIEQLMSKSGPPRTYTSADVAQLKKRNIPSKWFFIFCGAVIPLFGCSFWIWRKRERNR